MEMFNSRDAAFKEPFGAVENGTRVHFRITLPRKLGCSAARLIVEREGDTPQVLDMFWCGMNGDYHEWWECHYTPEGVGLHFYYFEANTCRGTQRLSRGRGGVGVFGSVDRWQMTVYSKDFSTPNWLSGGIMYQIFPDRFASSGTEKTNVPYGRRIHEGWLEQPEWRPNELGKVTNSDFFGGDLKGIEQKLPYLKKLGVTCIYCNPIFESHSNHRYDTADYSKIDPLLGTEEDFSDLCAAAKKLGIRVIIDGVFSHTGSDSIYFNREGRYPEPGAYQSRESQYSSWYTFKHWPNDYDCWWNFVTLPNVRETEPTYDSYINGDGGIVQKWIKAGASGWRLDVADELPDEFIDHLSAAAKSTDPNALVLGEVWEDASNKSAYGVRRRYLLGGQLDTVMNYPFRDAILGFLLGENACEFKETVESIVENYPPQCLNLLMNHIGTHDTERAITVLGGEASGSRGREWQSAQKLSAEQRQLGKKRLRLASLMQYLLPGVPCIYYGDEAGVEGYRDPFNRTCYPWGQEDDELVAWYEALGRLRCEQTEILSCGSYRTLLSEGDLLAFERSAKTSEGLQSLVLIVNRGGSIQCPAAAGIEFKTGTVVCGENILTNGTLSPFGFSVVKFTHNG